MPNSSSTSPLRDGFSRAKASARAVLTSATQSPTAKFVAGWASWFSVSEGYVRMNEALGYTSHQFLAPLIEYAVMAAGLSILAELAYYRSSLPYILDHLRAKHRTTRLKSEHLDSWDKEMDKNVRKLMADQGIEPPMLYNLYGSVKTAWDRDRVMTALATLLPTLAATSLTDSSTMPFYAWASGSVVAMLLSEANTRRLASREETSAKSPSL